MKTNNNITITDVLLVKPFKYKKKVRAIIERYNHALALLQNETKNELDRLNNMSQINANYINEFNEANNIYDRLMNLSASTLKTTTENLVKNIDNKQYKGLKEQINIANNDVEDFYNAVSKLNDRIKSNFEAEAEVTKLKCDEQSELRRAKDIYRDNQSDLILVKDSYDRIFSACDELCIKADNYIQNGQYQEAKNLLNNDIHKLNMALNETLSRAPRCCVCISQLLPNELRSLKNLYSEMETNNYPIYHILSKNDLENLDDKLRNLNTRCCSLRFTNVERDIDFVSNKIKTYKEMLQKEKDAKNSFETNKETVYKNVENTSNIIVSLINSVPRLEKAYLFDQETYDSLTNIENSNETLMKLKNDLYSYEHSKISSPYTTLLNKMSELKKLNDSINQDINDFSSFLRNLKTCAENANKSLSEYTIKTRNIESQLINSNHEVLCSKYIGNINNIYKMIDELYAVIKKQPINVKEMNMKFENLQNNAGELYYLLEDEFKNLEAAEKAMIDLNTSRLSIKECDRQFKQAEELFYQGDFKEACNKAYDAKLIDKEVEEAE